jgi:hypothetical protein
MEYFYTIKCDCGTKTVSYGNGYEKRTSEDLVCAVCGKKYEDINIEIVNEEV